MLIASSLTKVKSQVTFKGLTISKKKKSLIRDHPLLPFKNFMQAHLTLVKIFLWTKVLV